MDNLTYETYKFDKNCLKHSTFIGQVILFSLLVLIFFNYQKTDWIFLLFFLIVWFSFLYIIFQRKKILFNINNQKFYKIIIDKHSCINLIDKDNNILKLNKEDIIKNEITKIGANMSFGAIGTYECCLVKLGKIKFTTKSGEIYTIIISDIDDFVKKTIYQNIVKTIYI